LDARRQRQTNWRELQQTKHYETLLDVWPYHRIEINSQGQSRFKLTRLEKERLQSLGLQNLFSDVISEAGPPSQRTHQMQKELEHTLLKRYEEAKALEKKEKKKKKDIKKEIP